MIRDVRSLCMYLCRSADATTTMIRSCQASAFVVPASVNLRVPSVDDFTVTLSVNVSIGPITARFAQEFRKKRAAHYSSNIFLTST